MPAIGQIWGKFWKTFRSEKEMRLVRECETLKARLQRSNDEILAFEKENDKLAVAMALLNQEKADLLETQRKLQVAAITAADDIEVLKQRVILLRDGYTYNRGLVRTIISTTTNGFEDVGRDAIDADAAGGHG